MLYALIVAFGVQDIYFTDVVTYTTMQACEVDRSKQVEYIQKIHPWAKVVKGVCVMEHPKSEVTCFGDELPGEPCPPPDLLDKAKN